MELQKVQLQRLVQQLELEVNMHWIVSVDGDLAVIGSDDSSA